MDKHPPATVDEYLDSLGDQAFRAELQRIREIVRSEVPEAQEAISYGMPGFKLHGYLVGYAAFKKHCSFFPGGNVEEYADQLVGYKISKGTIQFTPQKPIPEALLRQIIRAQVVRNLGKSKVNRKCPN